MNGEISPKIFCEIRNFGPIREGSFELTPLTVFISPNGSGKTYAATLFYSIARALAYEAPMSAAVQKISFDIWATMHDIWATMRHRERPEIFFDALSQEEKKKFQRMLRVWRDEVLQQIKNGLAPYFGRESPESLARLGSDSFRIAARWGREDAPLMMLEWNWSRGRGWVSKAKGIEEIRRDFLLPDDLLFLPPTYIPVLLMNTIFGFSRIYYLPAARADLLQGWRALAGMAIRFVRKEFGLRPIELTSYSGVAGDFLLMLLEGDPSPWRFLREPEGECESAQALLEGEILQGYVDWRSREDPLLLFFQKRGEEELSIPLTAISSGAAELAPLDLLLRRRLLGPRDWLIIEEPEAHLHPENQRRIATAMVRLVRAGVRVLCTTHSDLILHQISNHLLLGEALQKGQVPETVGLDPKWDRLGYDEVGVYLFRMEDDGSVIEKIQPEPGFGIPEDEFLRVAESISSQTYRLVDAIETE